MKKLVQMRPAAVPDLNVETLIFVHDGKILLRKDSDEGGDFNVAEVAVELMQRYSVATMIIGEIEIYSLRSDEVSAEKGLEVIRALRGTRDALLSNIPQLSARQRMVLAKLLENKVNKEIATELDITVRTVKFHISNLLQKFDCSARVELINRFRPIAQTLVLE